MLSQSQTAGRLALALAAGAGLHSKGAANESGIELVLVITFIIIPALVHAEHTMA